MKIYRNPQLIVTLAYVSMALAAALIYYVGDFWK
jgi:hypothetical protein